MPIQTSSITTETNGDLSLDPNGTGKVKLTDLAGSEKPLGVNTAGDVGELDTAALTTLPESVVDNDFVVIQRSGAQYKIDATEFGGAGGANPSPGDVFAVPDFVSGTGTELDPFIITPAVVGDPGGSDISNQTITIGGQNPGIVGTFTDASTGAGVRFTQPAAVFNSSGQWQGKLVYLDTPNSTSGAIYTGDLNMGDVYFRWEVTQVANKTAFSPSAVPNASPPTVSSTALNVFGRVTGNYADTAGTLTATGAALFNVNSGIFGTTGSITVGQTLGVQFNQTTVDAAVENSVVSGTITGPSGFLLPMSLVVTRSPFTFSFPTVTDVAASAAATSDFATIIGINCTTNLVYVPADTTLTTPLASINGGAYTAIPSAAPGLSLVPGDTLRVRGTTGAGLTTNYTLKVQIGTTAATWTVTTVGATPAVAQPTIFSPVNGSDGIIPPTTLASSPYAASNAGTHASSDWQMYQADFSGPVTSGITTVTASDFANFWPYSMRPSAEGSYQGTEYMWYMSNLSANANNQNGLITGSMYRSSDGGKTFEVVATDFLGSTGTHDGILNWGPGSNGLIYDSGNLIAFTMGQSTFSNAPSNVLAFGNTAISTDGGFTWTGLSTPQGAFQGGVTFDGAGVQIMVACNNNSSATIQRSTDSGLTWTSVNGAGSFPPPTVFPYSGTGATWLVGGQAFNSLLISTDSGQTWTDIFSTIPGSSNTRLKAFMAASDLSGNILVQSVNDNNFYFRAAGQDAWVTKAAGSDTRPLTAEAMGYHSGRQKFTAADSDGLYWESTDGTTWTSYPGDYAKIGNRSAIQSGINNPARTVAYSVNAAAYWSGTGRSAIFGQNTTKLVLTDAVNLNKINLQDEVQEVGGSSPFALATVAAIDASEPSISVTDVQNAPFDVGSKLKDITTPNLEPPGAPTTDPPDASIYTTVINAAADTTNLVSYPLTDAELNVTKAYYSRVRYNSNDGPAIVSDYSSYNEFATADKFVPDPGDAMGGGFFGGQVLVGGILYNLVVAPKSSGENASLQYKINTGYSGDSALQGTEYGLPNQTAGLLQGAGIFPAFDWADALSIGGFTDWYIPAFYELVTLYAVLKPGTGVNASNNQDFGNNPGGYNPISVPSNTGFYESGGFSPSQCANPAFQEPSGAEFMSPNDIGSATTGYSTQGGDYSFYSITFNDGWARSSGKTQSRVFRAIRRLTVG